MQVSLSVAVQTYVKLAAGTFALMCIGLVIFRAQSPGDVGVLPTRLFVPTAGLVLTPALAGACSLALGL